MAGRDSTGPPPFAGQSMSIQFERPDISLKKHVIDGMRAAIVEGVFAPGQKLVERELCATFDVSRSLIREALQKLEAEALITIVPHRGPMVALITPSEARSIYAVREALEALARQPTSPHWNRHWRISNDVPTTATSTRWCKPKMRSTRRCLPPAAIRSCRKS